MKKLKILLAYGDYSHNAERRLLNTYGGLGYYRIVKIAEQIKDHEVTVMGSEILKLGDGTFEGQWDYVFKNYDVFWTNYFVDDRVQAAVLYHAQKHGKKVIIDCDDNFWDVPESNRLYERFKKKERERAFMSATLSLCDVICTTTFPMKEKMSEHFQIVHGLDKKIMVIPNLNDINDWNYAVRQKDPNKIKIGYSGSHSHLDDIKMILPSMLNVIKKHKNVYFEVSGILDRGTAPELFKGWPKEILDTRVALVAATETFKEFPKRLADFGWDIALAPLVDTPFNRCKSSIKFFEYAMYEIPCVASRVYPYFVPIKGKKVMEDGVTGLLCRPQEWEAKLESLILDEELRLRLGKNAREHVIKNFQYKDWPVNEIVNEFI